MQHNNGVGYIVREARPFSLTRSLQPFRGVSKTLAATGAFRVGKQPYRQSGRIRYMPFYTRGWLSRHCEMSRHEWVICCTVLE